MTILFRQINEKSGYCGNWINLQNTAIMTYELFLSASVDSNWFKFYFLLTSALTSSFTVQFIYRMAFSHATWPSTDNTDNLKSIWPLGWEERMLIDVLKCSISLDWKIKIQCWKRSHYRKIFESKSRKRIRRA